MNSEYINKTTTATNVNYLDKNYRLEDIDIDTLRSIIRENSNRLNQDIDELKKIGQN